MYVSTGASEARAERGAKILYFRGAAAALTAKLEPEVYFGFDFETEAHVNVLELEAPVALVRRPVKERAGVGCSLTSIGS